MSEGVSAAALRPTLLDIAYEWLFRIVAAYSLLFGVLYWIRLIGIHDGALWRFDTMPLYWQVAAASLAALFPFAGIGLWMLASWGPVIWFLCAAAETVMYAGFPELFGRRDAIVIAHAGVALLYVAFRVALHFQNRKRRI